MYSSSIELFLLGLFQIRKQALLPCSYYRERQMVDRDVKIKAFACFFAIQWGEGPPEFSGGVWYLGEPV
jgi:hypothetical protein